MSASPVTVAIGDLAFSVPALQPVEPCKAVREVYESPASYRDRGPWRHFSREPTMMQMADHADHVLAQAWAADRETHRENAAALESNARLRKVILAVMEAAQFPKTVSEVDRNSRARYPKRISSDAGYLRDLQRSVVTDDGFMLAEQTYNRRVKEYADYRAKAVEDEQRRKDAAARAEQDKIDKRKADIQLAQMIERYSLPITIDWDGVVDELCKKSKYADLAVAGLRTRGDWSEGFYRVEEALGRFTIETNRDKDIVADLMGCVRRADDGERDGRVFRDTLWSYTALFGLLEEQLAKDVQLALSHCKD